MNRPVCCRKLDKEDPTEEEELRNMKIDETEGEQEVRGKEYGSSQPYLNLREPMKTNKWNIGSDENPMMAIIGDYWDEEAVTQVV